MGPDLSEQSGVLGHGPGGPLQAQPLCSVQRLHSCWEMIQDPLVRKRTSTVNCTWQTKSPFFFSTSFSGGIPPPYLIPEPIRYHPLPFAYRKVRERERHGELYKLQRAVEWGKKILSSFHSPFVTTYTSPFTLPKGNRYPEWNKFIYGEAQRSMRRSCN